jgi:hypothetical protein
MGRVLTALLVAFAVAVVAFAVSRDEAQASVAYESPYTFDQTYGTALRLLRVDLGLSITERDPQNGYVMFDYTSPESGKRVHHGSLELVRSKEVVRVSVQLPTMPRYHEQMILDALVKKLATEHGDPPGKKHPPQPSPDGDADAGPKDGG